MSWIFSSKVWNNQAYDGNAGFSGMAYQFKPHEQPALPGSPATPDHPYFRRHLYLLIGILIGITSGLANALVTVNLAFAQGTLGLDSNESAWLTAAYLMTNVTGNLLLVKFRQQFGLQTFIRYMLLGYATATVLHLAVHGFWSSVAVRAASGVAGSGLSTLTVLYLTQGMTPARRSLGAMIGISIPQLATPLARMISPSLLISGDWHMLYRFELGLALVTLAAIMTLPLPPSDRIKAFEGKDFVTFAMLAPGLWLLIAVLSEGRIEWWTERAWIGWSLAASVALIAAGIVHEHRRANPLINTRWIGTREMLRLFAVAATVRILLSEQTFGSVGLLSVVGMNNDQMVTLNAVVILASIAGLVFALVTFNPAHVGRPITLAVVLIGIASFMDADSTNLTRPANFYVSQGLIGFATMLFMAEAVAIGFARTLLAGSRNLVSFVVLFGMSQSVGGLAGSALLGTFQTWREKYHSHELVQNIVMTDPQVAARLRAGAGAVAGVVGDPVLRSAEGAAILSQQVAREANILAYNDVFLLAGALSVLAALWGISIRYGMWRRGEESPIIRLQREMKARAAAAGTTEAGAATKSADQQ